MVATVSPWIDEPSASLDPTTDPTTAKGVLPAADRPTARSRPRYGALGLGLAIIVAAIAAYSVHSRLPSRQLTAASRVAPTPSSVGVLPFLDLTTQEMNEEYFADGLTEELIGDLSNSAGLRVPSPTSSFYFKGKQLPIPDIARQLGVAYVLDGSVRKSGNVYRVAVRLVRAENGYVVYTGTYDRPLGDLLAVQKSIAADAALAVRNAIGAAGTR
jgi:TolB-like protein